MNQVTNQDPDYEPEFRPEADQGRTIEVRVFRDDELVQRELCESEEQAAEVVEAWAEVDGVTTEVDDLSFHHRPGDLLEPEPAEEPDEDYPAEPRA
ncbi:hypothetical protein FNH05_24595 [Amycolatopsis rhizosphaerae]|uniref:Uncharacterized protein n=1 Tax=Amycolatopsis rhizosphaerae TaxID=2053003 RepID=A0A558BNN6_9PSEU|nr:hypothetical protein [Amycolatopsis rhizosphaerae]TVT38129.1 hypothetical protein FNH05_24595 [Amycolatopsis rhizosphaerae]